LKSNILGSHSLKAHILQMFVMLVISNYQYWYLNLSSNQLLNWYYYQVSVSINDSTPSSTNI
jgi:hypothetical protein